MSDKTLHTGTGDRKWLDKCRDGYSAFAKVFPVGFLRISVAFFVLTLVSVGVVTTVFFSVATPKTLDFTLPSLAVGEITSIAVGFFAILLSLLISFFAIAVTLMVGFASIGARCGSSSKVIDRARLVPISPAIRIAVSRKR
jgi:hypothetical protein